MTHEAVLISISHSTKGTKLRSRMNLSRDSSGTPVDAASPADEVLIMDFFTNLYFKLLPEINPTVSNSRTRCLCLEWKKGGNVLVPPQRRTSVCSGTTFLIVSEVTVAEFELATCVDWCEPF